MFKLNTSYNDSQRGCKILKKVKSLPSGFCRWVYGGHQLLLGPKTKQKGYLSNSYQTSKAYFYCNEWKCNIAQIASIAAFIANSSDYDLVLLQDLWMRPDHEMIRAALPKVIHNKMSSSSGKIVFCINLQNRVMTRVGDLAPALCDGRVLPTSCSGLALVSRWYDSTI